MSRKKWHLNYRETEGIAILSDISYYVRQQVDFRAKKITGGPERYYIMIKGSTHQENIAVLSVYASNERVPKYVMQKLIEMKKGKEIFTITVREFNTGFPTKKKKTRQKISMDTELNTTMNRKDLIHWTWRHWLASSILWEAEVRESKFKPSPGI